MKKLEPREKGKEVKEMKGRVTLQEVKALAPKSKEVPTRREYCALPNKIHNKMARSEAKT
eukprot:14778639-Ditylum_brightwellii.AAC.1